MEVSSRLESHAILSSANCPTCGSSVGCDCGTKVRSNESTGAQLLAASDSVSISAAARALASERAETARPLDREERPGATRTERRETVEGEASSTARLNDGTSEAALEPPAPTDESAEPSEEEASDGALATQELTEEEKQQVEELQQRDREVRQHEAAHKSALGGLGGAPQYDYETGPDGRQYAVGGEVSVQMSEVPGDPQATIQRAQQIARAATAPAEPSSQDYSVRAKAVAMEQ